MQVTFDEQGGHDHQDADSERHYRADRAGAWPAKSRQPSAVCEQLVARLESVDSVYISFDIDVVDPGFCPA